MLEAPKHDHLIKWLRWGHVTVWKIYISIFMRFISNKLGRLLTLGKIFSTQTLKSSPSSCYKLRQCATTKLKQLYYKLRQGVITNYGSFIKLLQITAAFGVITNYGNILLHITAGIKNYNITNHVVTVSKNYKNSFIKLTRFRIDSMDWLIYLWD